MIIADDVSSDETVEIIERYISDNNLNNAWKLIRNERNKGYIKNYIDAMNASTGEILFPCDQDDIWEKDKVEKMVKVVLENDAEAVYCLDDYIGSEGEKIDNKIGYSNRIKTKKTVKLINLRERLKTGRSPGLCLCFRRSILKDISEICNEYSLPHDLPIGLVAAVHNNYYLLNEVLVHHRIHLSNASSPDMDISISIVKDYGKYVISSNNVQSIIEGLKKIIEIKKQGLLDKQPENQNIVKYSSKNQFGSPAVRRQCCKQHRVEAEDHLRQSSSRGHPA